MEENILVNIKIVEMEKVFTLSPIRIFIWVDGNRIDFSAMAFTFILMEKNIRENS